MQVFLQPWGLIMTTAHRFWDTNPFPGPDPSEAFKKAGAMVGYDEEQEEYVVYGLDLEKALKIAKKQQLDYIVPVKRPA